MAWKEQPPDEPAEQAENTPPEDAEVVDLTRQRLLGWVRGMFGGPRKEPPPDDREDG
jgi:hypothetical protein